MKKLSASKIKMALQNWIANLKYLAKHDLSTKELDLCYKIKDETIEDFLYEMEEDKALFKTLDILDENESLKLLAKVPKSFCRLGDGEIYLMQGIDQGFQKYDSELAEKLLNLLKHKRNDMYVGINRAYFHTPVTFIERNRRFYRLNGTQFRRFFIENCDPDNLYLDAGFLTSYFRYEDDYDYEKHYRLIKALFNGKKIAIVSGEGVIEKLQYDVFEDAAEKVIIHGPSKNAYASYQQILDKILSTVDTSYTICLILGMTAKVMVPDLTDRGYMAWDVGHMAKDYDAYCKGLSKTKKEMDAFWAPD